MLTVVDSVMSSGKSTAMIKSLNDRPNERFIWITPSVSECDRLVSETKAVQPAEFIYETTNENGEVVKRKGRKIDHLRQLITSGVSIVTTQSLFLWLKESDLERLNTYIVVLDEAVTCTTTVGFSTRELDILKQFDCIDLQDHRGVATKVKWVGNDSVKDRIDSIYKRFFSNYSKEMYISETSVVAFLLPAKMLSFSKDIYILTYNFENTEMQKYLKFQGITYTMKTIKDKEIADYEKEDGSKFRDLITVLNNPKLNEVKKVGRKLKFTKSDFSEMTTEQLTQVSKNLYNFFFNIVKTKSEQNLWSCFSDFEMIDYKEADLRGVETKQTKARVDLKSILERKPFKTVGKLPKTLVVGSVTHLKKQCWVPINTRATNIYSDRTSVAYVANLNLQPAVKHFFNSTIGEAPSDDVFALNAMIQLIFRSAIRNNQPITVYVPSMRMRHLLLTWLGYTKEELF